LNNPKKMIKLCLIFSVISLVANVITLISDIYLDVNTFYIVLDILYLIAGVIAIVGFSVFNSKPIEYCISHYKWYITTVCFACICSLIVAIIAIMSTSSITSYKILKKQRENVDTIETEGKILPTAEELTKRIKTLDEMLKNNAITQEEYENLKQQILSELTK